MVAQKVALVSSRCKPAVPIQEGSVDCVEGDDRRQCTMLCYVVWHDFAHQDDHDRLSIAALFDHGIFLEGKIDILLRTVQSRGSPRPAPPTSIRVRDTSIAGLCTKKKEVVLLLCVALHAMQRFRRPLVRHTFTSSGNVFKQRLFVPQVRGTGNKSSQDASTICGP